MHVIFWLVSGVGACYFIFAKRRVDFFTVGFFGALFYFVPGFVGYVLYPFSLGFRPVQLVPSAYLVMATVLAVIVTGALCWDRFGTSRAPRITIRGWRLAPAIAVGLALIGLAGVTLTTGKALLVADKIEMMEHLNRWYILFTTSAAVGAVLAFEAKSRALLVLSLLLLVVDVVVGFRASLVITIIALAVLSVSRHGPHRLWRNAKTGLFVAAVLAALVIYNGLFVLLRHGGLSLLTQEIGYLDVEWYLTTVSRVEPFITQAILNEVLISGFSLDWRDHLTSLVYQTLLFAPELGAEVISFNDLFQPTLFPGSDWMGMANNPWAELFSLGGWVGLIAGSASFSVMLALGSYLLLSADNAIRAGSALTFSWWAFYAHRNDFLNQMSLEKRTIIVWVTCIFISMLIVASARSRRDARGRVTANEPRV